MKLWPLLFVLVASTVCAQMPADLNGDGRVDFRDFLAFARDYGKTSPASALRGFYTVDRIEDEYGTTGTGCLVVQDGYALVFMRIRKVPLVTYGPAILRSGKLYIHAKDMVSSLAVAMEGRDKVRMDIQTGKSDDSKPMSIYWRRVLREME